MSKLYYGEKTINKRIGLLGFDGETKDKESDDDDDNTVKSYVEPTYTETLCDPRYRGATWFAIYLAMSQ